MSSSHQTEKQQVKLSISPNWDGYQIWVRDNQENDITLEIDIDEGKVEIVSVNESANKEIRTSQTIFKSAE